MIFFLEKNNVKIQCVIDQLHIKAIFSFDFAINYVFLSSPMFKKYNKCYK